MEKKPFLSIIMRTQGKRTEALQEALLCLYAQTDMDFEVCLMAHQVSERGMADITEVVERMPMSFQKKIRVIPVNYGGRTAPLSEGFLAAAGEYTAAFDDDDLVFEHWVETFHEMAREHGGKVLHAYCVQQKWLKQTSPYGDICYTAAGRLQNEYCTPFDFIRQLCGNFCPIHSVAFPSAAYQKMGFRFDESFDVLEDWDFLSRTTLACGVEEREELTSLYRIWENAENSRSLHEEEIWEKNREKVLRKLDEQPLTLPEGSASKIVKYIEQNPLYSRIEGRKLWMQIFFDTGNGYNEKESVHLWASTRDGRYRAEITEELPEKIDRLRIDPGEEGMLIIRDARITVGTSKGELTKKAEGGNGYPIREEYVFLERDPQLYVELGDCGEGISSLRFEAEYSYEVTAEVIDQVVAELVEKERQRRSIGCRCKRAVRRILGR